MDIPLIGGTFTWSNNWNPPCRSRIGRFLVSPYWEAQFAEVSQKRLKRLCSGYFPTFLDCGEFHEGKMYFTFKNMWLKS
jgi:hypothetical protein